ncbi:HlyD family type I secretion periplasmic adaptor subunit [Arsenophonus nasoniae]|uniref:Membrane fusion protein (MFP) family protein n=1 Tax=Arsenophonus nasoniae TaxID=638 RepID=A0AA95KDX3_9GAMM|nr:HlyD family type I secretion periplasmic adaptor subunit [Arsenophonus nasoniae]WGL95467.1 HlyD family type I secretion periplasmic adaptor subunit [Arsenophonus nasoniae]WGM02079.1 HlyD family type I secretion periplasmic adaptor subunit [Arsenophonus nasoniae]
MSVQGKYHKSSPILTDKLISNEKRAVYLGWLLVTIGFGGFLLWSALAPLDKGVPVSGNVIVAGNHKTIQHQYGGIIEQLSVNNGEKVQAGQILLTLNTVEVRSEYNIKLKQYHELLVREARLLAEQQGKKRLIISSALQREMKEHDVNELLQLNQQLLENQYQVLQLELAGIKEKITGLNATLYAQQQKAKSQKTQLTMLLQQLEGLRELEKNGYIARNTLLETENKYTEVDGNLAQTLGDISRIQHQILEQKLHSEKLQQEYQKDVHAQLADTQTKINHTYSQLVKAKFILANAQIRAPVAGTIIGMSVFTEGGVIVAGQKMMEIVPDDQPLLVDARVPVQLIDQVKLGLPVELQFTAFNQSTTPKVEGNVTMISADRLLNEQTGEPYYLLQVQVNDKNRQRLNQLTIKPGMPVEVFIRTGERSLLNYLFKPLFDRLHMSLNED